MNGLFELRTDTRLAAKEVNLVTVQSSASIETASPQGIECHDERAEHKPSQPTPLSPERELQEVIRHAKRKAGQIKEATRSVGPGRSPDPTS